MRGKGFKWNAVACIVVVVTLTGLLPVEILPVVGEAEKITKEQRVKKCEIV